MIVLDSSALLAMLFFEPGCARVAELVPRSGMSTVNPAEVLGRSHVDGRALDEALDRAHEMGIAWVGFDRDWRSAQRRRCCRPYPGACPSETGRVSRSPERTLPAVTADRPWAKLDLGIAIEVVH